MELLSCRLLTTEALWPQNMAKPQGAGPHGVLKPDELPASLVASAALHLALNCYQRRQQACNLFVRQGRQTEPRARLYFPLHEMDAQRPCSTWEQLTGDKRLFLFALAYGNSMA